MTRTHLLALGWLALSLALSCAGQARAPSRFTRADTLKDDIRDRWNEIRAWRAEIGLRGVEPEHNLIQRYVNVPMHELRQELATMCELPAEPTETCTDVCNIAESICENAEKICDIAGELPGDSWAEQKCASAKASCKQAKQRCCRCEGTRAPNDR